MTPDAIDPDITQLSGWQREWVKAARASVDEEELALLCQAATDIPSPTGCERELAEYFRDVMTSAGTDSRVQSIDERQANLVTRVGTGRTGAQLLLLAPLDTAFAPGREDAPWLGERPRHDFTLPAQRYGDKVVGLGAENPKAFASCALAAALAVHRSGVPLDGQLVVALVGGSMPVLAGETVLAAQLGHGRRHPVPDGPRPVLRRPRDRAQAGLFGGARGGRVRRSSASSCAVRSATPAAGTRGTTATRSSPPRG